MSDEKTNNPQPEKQPVATPQDAHQESTSPETKQINFSESAIKNAGDQGISLKPVGSHDTNPFLSQDIAQTQPAGPTVAPKPLSAEAVTPPPAAQSGGSTSDVGE